VRCPGKRRSRSGKGQRIEVNLLSSLLSSLTNQASAYLATGRSPERMGNQHPSVAPYETLRCKDGYLAVCCGNDTQFRRLAAVLEIPFLAEDSRFVTNAARVAHRADLVAAMEEMLRRDTTDVWAARLTDVEVSAGKSARLARQSTWRPHSTWTRSSHSVTSRARRFGIRSPTRQRP
jgi:crotonobetainyl-CoA:carnitine CoA-transferase CaiB-like acyl-CoA transferase